MGPRKRLVASLVALALAGPMALCSTAQVANAEGAGKTSYQAEANKATKVTKDTFADPVMYDKPWARWNWAEEWMTKAQVEADIQDAYDTNIGGLEIGQTSGNSTVPRSIDVWKVVYEKANSLGMKISQKVVSSLAPDRNNTPTTYTGYDDYARRTLEFGSSVVVNPGADLTNYDVSNIRATSPTNPTMIYPTIVSVLAYQCTTDPCSGAGTATSPYVVDRAKVVELTSQLTNTDTDGYEGGTRTGTLNWTNNTDLPYVIKVIRAVPYGGNNTPETLSAAGTDLVTESYDEWFQASVGGGRTLGDLVKDNGGDFFVDSHGNDPWAVPYELWSSNMRADFKSMKGYDILTNIVALEGNSAGSASGVGTRSLVFSDESMPRIANDFYSARDELYIENRITRFQSWANTWNMALRLQHEDASTTNSHDQASFAASVDRNEYESLIADDNHDAYRQMASGIWMSGNQWFSTECCAVREGGFLEDVQDTMIRMSKEFAGGVDRPVYHVRGAVGGANTTWPGGGHTNTTKNGWSGYYSSIQPYHENFDDINDYYARNGMVLRAGQAKLDVAVYMVDYVAARNTSHWTDTSLQEAGYTWGYLNDTLMSFDNAKVTDGVLAEDGPGYKALVFNRYITPDANAAKGTLTSRAAKKMLQYAKSGLPIIFVGEPTGVSGLTDSNKTLRTYLAALYAQPNVYQVDSYAELTAKLKKIGVEPNLKPEKDTHLLSMNRHDEATDSSFYWIYNYGINLYQQQNISSPTGATTQAYTRLYENESSCFIPKEKTNSLWDRRCIKGTGTYKYSDNPVSSTNPGTWLDYNDDSSFTVSLLGEGVPYALDAYSGAITPITDYERVGDRVELTIDLAVDDSTIIALGSPTRFGDEALSYSAVETTGAFTTQVGDNLVLAADAAGTYSTTLSSGDVVDTAITQTPPAIDLSTATWDLVAEDWQPTAAYGTVGWAGSETTKHTVTASVTAGSLQKYSDRGVTDANKWAMQEYEYLTDDGMLPSWYHIDGLKYASGIGTYTTTVNLDAWDPSWVAMLDLGEVFDSFTVTVNGTTLPFADMISATTDIGPYLQAGANTLSVRVTTTLNNRLYQLGEAISAGTITSGGAANSELTGAYTRGVLTHYGLIGPVTITPYATAVVSVLKPLANTAAPTVSGVTEVGSTLTADTGTWTAQPSAFTYQWLRDDQAIEGATSATYGLTAADAGKKISVRVTATLDGYKPATADSAPVGPVVKSKLSNSVLPKVVGTAKVGYTLSVDDGTWSPKPEGFTYQWLRNGWELVGQTGATYTLTPADLGGWISVQVTANAAGSESLSALTTAVGPVVKGTITNVTAPSISGKAKVGSRLYANRGSWSPTPASYSFRWYRNGKAIKNAKYASYKLTRTDRGTKITVKVTAKLTGYANAAKISKAVGPIKK